MGQAVDEARRQIELTRDALASDLDRLEARVRKELDWKARLRRDAPQIIAVGVAVVAVGVTAVVLRRRFGGRKQPEAPENLGRVSLADLAREVRELRKEVEKRGTSKGKGPLWQKAAIGAATAAASAGGRMAAKKMMERSEAEQAAAHR